MKVIVLGIRRGPPRRCKQNQLLDEEIGKIPEQLLPLMEGHRVCSRMIFFK
jgi:hypothetical protein